MPSASLTAGGAKTCKQGRRLPAGDLDRVVIERLRAFFSSSAEILDALDNASHGGPAISRLIDRARQLAEEFRVDGPETAKALLKALLCRVEIKSDGVDIKLSRTRLASLLSGETDLARLSQEPPSAPGESLTLTAPAALRRVG